MPNSFQSLDAESFIGQSAHYPVIDVRTPSEFAQGHIPGAENIPLFSDEERRIVGTLYKQDSRETAILTGLDFA
nr:rhodanese-like domain-containing protein [Bacteroidota bacterium]